MRFLPVLLLAATTAGAQQSLSLQDAIALAQRQGPQAQMARSQRDAARYRNDAFNANLLPQMRLVGDAANLNHGINAITLPDGSTQFIGQAQNQSTLGLAIDQRVPLTGGTVTFGSEMSRLDLFGDRNGRTYSTTPFYVALQQDLFKPRTLVWQEKEQSLAATVAERGYLEAREDVAANVAGAFFDLYAAQMSLTNATANQAVNDTLYQLNNGRYEVGKIGENDLLKSQLQLLRARASVDDAKLQRDRAEAALRRQLVMPEGQPLTIVTPDSIPNLDVDPDVAVREALRNASVMEQNVYDETLAKQGITTATLGSRFNATLQASVGFNQTATYLGQAYQSPLGKQALQVGINMPMMQWGAGRANIEAARADMQRVQSNNKTRRDALAEDGRFSALQLQQAQRNVLLAAKADTVSAKQFEVARNRYTIGKISNTDLYNAQNDKDQAVLAYVQALRSYWMSYYHLRRVTLYDFATKTELSDSRDR
ncbi:MAG TPA: TolC family protein [Gemmatimonadaceae bacterium]|jgi:outer membrane protein TolC|nr:TolC family protein [Gemmatimonadaceae bacterium]